MKTALPFDSEPFLETPSPDRIRSFFDPRHAALHLQPIQLPELDRHGVQLACVRDDRLHPMIAGNKWWKLKHTLLEAARASIPCLVTFGGAYSNHILALAAAGYLFGFRTVGLIRGEETRALNPVLKQATDWGMELVGIPRDQYRQKHDPALLQTWKRRWDPCWILPEGGSGPLAVRGASEMVARLTEPYDYLCAPVGTGGTLAGMIAGARPDARIMGFSSLKGGGFLEGAVRRLLEGASGPLPDWSIVTDFHFGGYAKSDATLQAFQQQLHTNLGLELDLVYTAKMFYGILQSVERGVFEQGSRIIAWHTGNAWSPACAKQGRSEGATDPKHPSG